jgi:hypothetical protein
METNIMTRSHGVEEASDHVLDDDPEGHLVAIPSPAPATISSLPSIRSSIFFHAHASRFSRPVGSCRRYGDSGRSGCFGGDRWVKKQFIGRLSRILATTLPAMQHRAIFSAVLFPFITMID